MGRGVDPAYGAVHQLEAPEAKAHRSCHGLLRRYLLHTRVAAAVRDGPPSPFGYIAEGGQACQQSRAGLIVCAVFAWGQPLCRMFLDSDKPYSLLIRQYFFIWYKTMSVQLHGCRASTFLFLFHWLWAGKTRAVYDSALDMFYEPFANAQLVGKRAAC